MNPYLAKLASLSLNQALILGAVLTFVYYLMVFDDGTEIEKKIAGVQSQLTTERTKERESEQALARIKQLRENYQGLTDQFRIVSTAIPSDLQMSEIIRTVDTMAKTSGVVIKSKEPKLPVREDILETMPIRVVAEGTFSEVAMFFYNLSTIDRIYRIRNFSLIGPQDDRRANQRLKVEAELASFRFVGDGGGKK